MKDFPVMYQDKPVGRLQLDEKVVSMLEKIMEHKFESLDCEPFLMSVTFSSNINNMSMKMESINIQVQ